MKLVKTARLFFTQGASDKVYEVDLCEQQSDDPQRYWVNFRYGRRGSTLREGTKTVTPVDLAQAEAIFKSVVVAKTNKGYQEAGSHSFSTGSAFSSSLNTLLRHIDSLKESQQRARSIWRLPQQPDTRQADWLEKGINERNHWLENYARLWTLGRVGDGRNLARVKPLLTSETPPLRSLALEVWLRLGDDDDIAGQKAQLLASLPGELTAAIAANDSTALDALLRQQVTEHNPHANALLKTLYLAALDSAPLHQSLLTLLDTLPLRPGLFQGVRYLFKMAEFRLDAPMFALLAWRFDTSRHFYSADWDGVYLDGVGYIKPSKELLRTDSRLAYSRKTRDYLRRRSWRALRRLGARDDPRYVEMASAMLLQYREEHLMPEKQGWGEGNYAADAHLFAWNAILRSANPAYQRHHTRALWIKLDDEAPDLRGEAFPQLWDRRPDALLNLLLQSESEAVCAFALRAMQENTAFCRALSDQQLAELLGRPFPAVVEFVLSRLAGRLLSRDLLLALIQSKHPQARILALTQLNSMRLFDDSELAAALLLTDDAEIRTWLDGRFQAQPLSATEADALAQLLFRRLNDPATVFSTKHAGWLAVCITSRLSGCMSQLSLETLSALLAHPDTGVQLLAARLLVASHFALDELPEALVAQLHASPVAQIRAAGIALLGKLSPEGLLRQLPQLVALLSCGEAEEREASYALLAQLAQQHAQAVFDALFPLLFQKEEQEGAHAALLAFITGQLAACLAALDNGTLWRLIHARAQAAQTLGAEILQSRSALTFSVRQWAALASHPLYQVRAWALRAFTEQAEIACADAATLSLLESDWPQTREFGFAFLRQHYPAESWTPALIVNLCDSHREDVQAYGRELLQTFFKHEQGEEYLLKLSQHPSVTVQTFVTHFFQQYAGGKPDIILALAPCFRAILSQVNRGRVAKDRTLAFLSEQAAASPQVLEMVGALLSQLSLTVVQKDKGPLIKALLQLRKNHAQLNLPLEIVPRPVQGERHAG